MTRPPLFWSEEYWELRSATTRNKFRRVEKNGYFLYLDVSGETIKIPGSATFGGWWRNSADYNSEPFHELFEFLFTKFPKRRWQVNFPPTHFFPQLFKRQVTYLETLGGRLVREQNSSILAKNLGNDDVVSRFSRGNRKRVRAFRESGGVVRAASPQEHQLAFSILSESRERRGVSLSMTWEDFSFSLDRLPQVYQCWLALNGPYVVGAALTVKVSQSSLYVLYWGDTLLGREQSVSASICERLAAFAWSEKMEVLDLGISSVDGIIDEGLLRFKRNLGAVDFDQWTVILNDPR